MRTACLALRTVHCLITLIILTMSRNREVHHYAVFFILLVLLSYIPIFSFPCSYGFFVHYRGSRDQVLHRYETTGKQWYFDNYCDFTCSPFCCFVPTFAVFLPMLYCQSQEKGLCVAGRKGKETFLSKMLCVPDTCRSCLPEKTFRVSCINSYLFNKITLCWQNPEVKPRQGSVLEAVRFALSHTIYFFFRFYSHVATRWLAGLLCIRGFPPSSLDL
jgi:hypothetical protein